MGAAGGGPRGSAGLADPAVDGKDDRLDERTRAQRFAVTVDDLDATLARLKEQAIEPERPPYIECVRAAGGSRSCLTVTSPPFAVSVGEA